jgi:hypothetical protein
MKKLSPLFLNLVKVEFKKHSMQWLGLFGVTQKKVSYD